MDTDIAHVNVSFDDGSTTAIQNQNGADDDGTSAFAWHYDSFPFVCVMMLSNCTGMVGGETALRKPNGDVIKIRGPRMVCLPWHHVLKIEWADLVNHSNRELL